jgi:hypothetical protein
VPGTGFAPEKRRPPDHPAGLDGRHFSIVKCLPLFFWLLSLPQYRGVLEDGVVGVVVPPLLCPVAFTVIVPVMTDGWIRHL